MDITIGATLTGGSSATLSPSGFQPGKSTFTAPGHSRLEPKIVEFTSSNPGPNATSGNAVARAGLKVSFTDRQVEEGCCTVNSGVVAFDIGFRWALSQPEAVVDDVIEYLQGLVFSPQFVAAMKNGVLPSA